MEDPHIIKSSKPTPSGSGIATARTEKSFGWRIEEANRS